MSTNKLDQWRAFSDEVKRRARGHWEHILGVMAPELDPALAKVGTHVACPRHQDSRDGFRLFRDANETGGGCCNTCGFYSDGFALLEWLTGKPFKDLVVEVGELMSVSPEDYLEKKAEARAPVVTIRPVKKPAKPALDPAVVMLKHLEVWRQGIPLDMPEACSGRRYLENRGLRIDPENLCAGLLFVPSLDYYDLDDGGHAKRQGSWPALIAPIQDLDGKLRSIHKTYLTPDGRKAPVSKAKKLGTVPERGFLNGGAIRLARAGQVLCVTEGIETGLAVQQETGLPTWATANATLMELFDVPKSVRLLLIWADKDRSGRGEEAAAVLTARTKEKDPRLIVVTLMPDMAIPAGAKGIDWLDVVCRGGSEKLEQAPYLVTELLEKRA